MRNARAPLTRLLALAVTLSGLAMAPACVPKAVGRQTDIMTKSGTVSLSAAELRARVNDLAERFAGRLEAMADRISADTGDRGVRRRALVLKVDAIPAVYTTAYRVDPLIATVDMWGFAYQLAQYLEEGAGRDAFGSGQALARTTGRALVADADAVARGIVTGPEAFERARTRLEGWAKSHPIENTFAARSSVNVFLSELRSEERDAFAAVGAVTDLAENLSERLNTYAAQLPKIARWQAELLIAETSGAHDVESELDELEVAVAAARRAKEVLDDLPKLADSAGASARDIAAGERRAVLEGINEQRVATLPFITAERVAALAALREERVALVAVISQVQASLLTALDQERIAALKDADAIGGRAIGSTMAGLKDLVDYTLRRVAIFLVLLMAAAAAIGVIGFRLVAGRRS